MGKNTYNHDLVDAIQQCVYDLHSLFTLLDEGDFDGKGIVEVRDIGRTLMSKTFKDLAELCDLVEACLGKIEIKKATNDYPWKLDGEIIGLNFTPSENLKRLIQDLTPGNGLSFTMISDQEKRASTLPTSPEEALDNTQDQAPRVAVG
ncbi:MAG: hypothetical protein JRI95_13850 [Deltaproteobacteria bacterium]|nr:hypothetical protein [Deltaproteobacteria bacterium]